MKLSIVIPVFNEIKTIEKIIHKIERVILPEGVEREFVIIDDFSTDGTKEYLKNINKKKYIILFHETNQGKGASLKTGFIHCTGDIVIVQDADMEYNPDEYTMLIEPIINGSVDVVYGSRFMNGRPDKAGKYWHRIGNKVLTFLSNIFTNLHLTDMETCYKVFRREIIQNLDLKEKRFGVEPEVTAKISELVNKNKISLLEIPISYEKRAMSEGKKIGMKDAFRALWCIIKYNNTFFARMVKYSISGFFAAFFQLVAVIVLVKSFNIRTAWGQNIAYAFSLEVSIFTGFIIYSLFSWSYPFKIIFKNFIKFCQFSMITGLFFIIRQVLFYSLFLLNVNFKLNIIVGLIITVIINFYRYDGSTICKNRISIEE